MALKNGAALSAAVQEGSFVTRQGPLRADGALAALNTYAEMARQYTQLLDIVSQFAGPSLTPQGSPPAAPAALVTVNVTHDQLPGPDVGVLPSLSSMKMTSARAGIYPTFFMDRSVSNPLTVLTTGNIPQFTLNGINVGNKTYAAAATAEMTYALGVRCEIRAGEPTITEVVTWGSFITNIAGPLMNAYQANLQLLFNRIRATYYAVAADRRRQWIALNGVTPDATQQMLDQLRVLRDPAGNPLYIPPAQASTARDNLIGAVVDMNLQYPDAVEFTS